MNTYKRHRFPPDIISYAVWLYYRFNLSHRDVENLLAEWGITVTRESIRLLCNKFEALYARRLKGKHRGYGDTFYIDEVFVKISGKQHYLWRAVDQDGVFTDRQSAMVLLQSDASGALYETMAANPGKSRLINCELTELHTGNAFLTRSTVRNSMRIIGQSNRMRRLG